MTDPPPVPFVDLSPSHAGIKTAFLADLAALIDSGAFVDGPAVGQFELEFAARCGRRRCVGLSNGSDALRLTLIAAGVEPGDEVVVPALTFVATAEAVVQAAARPVLADISEADFGLDAVAAEAAIGGATRALVAVHLYGQLADVGALSAVVAPRDVALVEDAAQAQGATREGRLAGTAGLAATFGFDPTQNLGAMGDAGACVTEDEGLAQRVAMLRDHGQRREGEHELVGFNARLDTIQALALLHKLPHLESWTRERRAAAALYSSALEGVGDLRMPPVAPDSDPVWHLYVVRTADPARLAEHLATRAIASGRHYSRPLHLQAAFAGLGYERGDFPVAEAVAREALSLPIFPGITPSQLHAVVDGVKSYFDG